jgi:hypothetical protein
MKELSGEKVYRAVEKNTKKLQVCEVVKLLIGTLREINHYKNNLVDEETFNTIITYFSLTLLSRTNNSKDYEKIFNECLTGEIKESEA